MFSASLVAHVLVGLDTAKISRREVDVGPGANLFSLSLLGYFLSPFQFIGKFEPF